MIDDLLLDEAIKNYRELEARVKYLETLAQGVNVGQVDFNQFGWDAAGRQRVSEITTLSDSKLLHDDDDKLFDQVLNGTATGTYSSAKKAVPLTTAASGDYGIRQSKQWFHYQSGKSQIIDWTFQDLTPEENITKRAGYFSSSTVAPYTADFDGIYLESASDQVVLKVDKGGVNTYTSAALTGIDWSKFTIAIIDFLWLGGSTVRLWLIQNGKIVLEDAYKHAGNVSGVMMDSPNQPIRYEIRQGGTGSGTLDAVCSMVASEGATNIIGKSYPIDNGVTAVAAASAGTIYALKGFRLQATRRNIIVSVDSISMVNISNNRDFKAMLILNPTVTGTFTYANKTGTSIQEATGAGATVTGGFELFSAYSGQSLPISEPVNSALRVGSKIDGTMDEIVLCVQPVRTNEDILGAINLLEL